MSSVTIELVVQDAIGILGEVAGIGVQEYSEPRMIKDAGRAFNMIFKKRWWEQYTKWTTHVLDGANGIVNASAFTQVLDFEDFAAVHRAGTTRPLPTLPSGSNPSTIIGTSPHCWTMLPASHASYVTHKIKIYPIASTGSIDVRARYHPLTAGSEWADATVVHFDRDLLALGTAFMALSGDDLNPGAKTDVQNQMDVRYKDIERAMSSQAMGTGASNDIPREWRTV